MNICADILQNIENDSNFLGNVITCDESCFFSMTWKLSANTCMGRVPGHQEGKKGIEE
jgi:hypothetical protein